MSRKLFKTVGAPSAAVTGAGLAKGIKPKKKKKGVFSPATAAKAIRRRGQQLKEATRED